jgi:hypothetical protein
MNIQVIFRLTLLFSILLACQAPQLKDKKERSRGTTKISNQPAAKPPGAVQKIDPDKGMSNPVMLSAAGGADIGRLFNAYYRVGQQNNMYPFLDSQTKKKFSKEKILQLLTKLDFGYDIRLSGATNNNPNYVLTYTCQIAQTKVIKQLKVVVENDTARIIPSNLLQGKIFQ